MSNNINTKEIKKLLSSHIIFMLARKILAIFITIYIWNLTKNFADIAIFHIVFYLSHSLFFSIWAPYVKKGYASEIKKGGLVGLILFYLILLLLKETAVDYLIPLGILWGLPNGAYWISYHVQNFDITNTKNRGHYVGTERSLRILVSILAPILGGFLITTNFIPFGYSNIFILGMILQTLSLIMSNTETKYKNTHPFHLSKTLKEVFKNKDFLKTMIAGTMSNIGYVRALTHILQILLFVILANEFKVGGWISFFSIIAIITTYTAGKILSYKKYKKAIILSNSILSLSLFSLILHPALITYILFGAVKEILTPIIGLVRRIYNINLIHTLKQYQNHRVEFMVIREWFQVGIGGTISFIPLIFAETLNTAILSVVLSVMAMAIITEGILIKLVKTDITKL